MFIITAKLSTFLSFCRKLRHLLTTNVSVTSSVEKGTQKDVTSSADKTTQQGESLSEVHTSLIVTSYFINLGKSKQTIT